MASNLLELFGYSPHDPSPAARAAREGAMCPFIQDSCTKHFRDGVKAGACSLVSKGDTEVIICPLRLYYEKHQLLAELAQEILGHFPVEPGVPGNLRPVQNDTIFAFGKGSGHEIRLPGRLSKQGKRGSFFVDWIFAHVNSQGLKEFSAIEVQTIDTTGNYRGEFDAYMDGQTFAGTSTAGFNWENVNKRILPQLIYKGHVLRREKLCAKGMHFVCPEPVYHRIIERLGGRLTEIHPQPGSLTFHWYNLDPATKDGEIRKVSKRGSHTTTVDQVALAFTSPVNLPESGAYEKAIRAALGG
jgi:hypothetical protein